MFDVVFLTCDEYPQFTEDEKLLINLLKDYNINVLPQVWDKLTVDLNIFPMVLVRTLWDYHKKIDEFKNFLDQNVDTSLFNDASILRWNMDKSYLKDLNDLAIKIPKFDIFDKLFDPSEYMELNKISKLVLKPTISAGGRNTYLIDEITKGDYDKTIAGILSNSPVIAQEYVADIKSLGEWSFIYFDKVFSHAVIKMPAKDEFKVQERFGGSISGAYPSSNMLYNCQIILDKLPLDLLYARIDAVIVDSVFYLMEVELFEPSLFLQYSDVAAQNFCKAILKRLKLDV